MDFKNKYTAKQPSSVMLDKALPSAVDLECAVLGALMIEPESFEEIKEILTSESFYKDIHSIIFKAISNVYNKTKKVDILIVAEELNNSKELENIGGAVYLVHLTNTVISASHIKIHAEIVAQKYNQREIIKIANEIQEQAYTDVINIDNFQSKLTVVNEKSAIAKLEEVDLDAEVEEAPIILSIRDHFNVEIVHKRLITLGNISAVTGKAKSKKSHLTALLMAHLLKAPDEYAKFLNRLPENKRLCIYVDTEMGKSDNAILMKKIITIAGTKDNFKAFLLRKYTPKERVQRIEQIFKKYGDIAGFVLIDGCADLVENINSVEEAKYIESMLLRLSDVYNVHIMNIIHQNKADNFAGGHIGSMLMKKSEIVIAVEKIVGEDASSKVSCDMIRGGASFEDFQFTLDRQGMPNVDDYQNESVVAEKKEMDMHVQLSMNANTGFDNNAPF